MTTLFELGGSKPARDLTPPHVISWGAGVESSAYLVEVCTDPDRHGIDLAQVVVLHAVVGSEYPDTLRDSERFVLPMLRDRGVRVVQLSRRGPRREQGIEILDDTTTARLMHHKGPWTLAQHNTVNGVLPQLSNRRCSLEFKGWVLDQFLLREFPHRPYTHVIGYNRDEVKRASRDEVYATETRYPAHPLIDWDWSRDRCRQRLHDEFGIWWRKSACDFCCFAGSSTALPALMRRMREFPDRAADALLAEHRALFFNPRSKMFGKHSLHERLTADGNTAALALFERRLEESLWSIYDVRRIFFRKSNDQRQKGPGWRSVNPLFTGSRADTLTWLHSNVSGVADPADRVWIAGDDDLETYPRVEHFIGAGQAGTNKKSRAHFGTHWAAITGDTLFDRP